MTDVKQCQIYLNKSITR